MTYFGADLVSIDAGELRSLGLTDRNELVSDEVDKGVGGEIEHRFWFSSTAEFGVRFRNVEINVQPASSVDRRFDRA